MIELKSNPGDRIVELGGGDRPRVRPNVDCRPGPAVDVVADFNKPLPFKDGEFDGAFSQYALEHVSWRNVRAFLKEVCRIIKPGGKAAFVVPNTEEQMKWVLSRGWERRPPRDGMAAFEEASCVLFGDLDYPENSHKAFLSPPIIEELLKTAGFAQVHVTPYGECGTDMVVEAVKAPELPPPTLKETNVRLGRREQELEEEYARRARQGAPARERNFLPNVLGTNVERKLPDEIALAEKVNEVIEKKLESAVRAIPLKDLTKVQVIEGSKVVSETSVKGKPQEEKLKIVQEVVSAGKAENRAPLFDRAYFNGGGKVGGYAREGYWDYPVHEVTARHILARKPESVLELGCARGYVLKRVQDTGIYGAGLEISKHCYMTRVCDNVLLKDLCVTPWTDLSVSFTRGGGGLVEKFDLCYSVATLEHVPEEHVPAVIREMARTCKRGLHGIDFGQRDDGFDKTHICLKPKSWWEEQFAKNAPGWPVEILDKEELERGDFPKEVLEGDGRLKVNVGCVTEDTLIHTVRGYRRIDEVKVGDLVLTHKGRYRRVNDVSVRHHRGRMHRINVLGMGSIRITPEHPVYVVPDMVTRRGNVRRVGAEGKQWVEAKDVRREHFTFYPFEAERMCSATDDLSVFSAPGKPSRFPRGRRGHLLPKTVSADLFRFLGYYLAEGSVSKNQVSFCFHRKEKSYIDDVRRIGAGLFGTVPYERERGGDAYELVFSNVRMAELLHEMGGRYSEGKRLHDTILGFDQELQRQILVGAFRGDGSVARGRLSYGTVSSELARQIKFLLYRQGVLSRISVYDAVGVTRVWGGRVIQPKHVARHVRPSSTETAAVLCSEIFPGLERGVNKQSPSRKLKDGFYGYVRDVEEFDYDGPVWNLEVDEDNTYVTEIGVVHNSFTTMFHHGWVNVDQHDLAGWAQGHGYRFHKCDVRQGLPFGTGAVDLVYAGHFLNQLTYKEATAFLRDCRRVIRPDGVLRFIVPDARLLMTSYHNELCDRTGNHSDFSSPKLSEFDEVNENCAAAPTAVGKLWSLLHDGHQSCWDAETLMTALDGAGFHANNIGFRRTVGGNGGQLLRETLDTLPCLSLFVEAHPRSG